jgi:patatin-like phospholipase/acyl hydrolase
MNYPDRWKALRTRYETLAPRRLLALDGGGIRGLITLGILKRIEDELRQGTNMPDLKLCDWFDYIAGTSTGAIIAAGLALGLSVDDLILFYRNSGKEMFQSNNLLGRLHSLYVDGPLINQLQATFGAKTTLEPQFLKCLLLVVTRNTTTDSPWPISSNPEAKYNDPARPDCNLRIPLWRVVRASTAAPVYFPPEDINLDPAHPEKFFTFVDGGMTPYNNPAFLLYRMATQAAYNLNWTTGEDNLLLVSVGTGAAPHLQTVGSTPNLLTNAQTIPSNLMYSMSIDQDTVCRTVGRCVHGAMLDRELGDQVHREQQETAAKTGGPVGFDDHRSFRYARYNADLTREGLDALGLYQADPDKVQKLDAVDQMDTLLAIGNAAGNEVTRRHFGSFLVPPR